MKKLFGSLLMVSLAFVMILGIPHTHSANAAEDDGGFNMKEVVAYGQYNGVQLKWEVVAKDGDKATLFLKDVLRDGTSNPEGDMLLMQFNEKDLGEGSEGQNEWRNSSIKTFLNGDFYNAAFTSEQQEAIVSVSTSYPGYSSANSTRQGETVENPYVDTNGYPCKVFLPTYGDIASWYESFEDRALGDTSIWWWTRSPVYVVPGSVNPDNGGERQLVWYAHEGGENRAPVSYYLALRPVIVVDTTSFVADVVTSTVSGTVNPGAKVVLYKGNTKIAETTADANGKYSFSSVEAGKYTLEVSLNGYTTQKVEITVGSENVVKNITLQKAKKKGCRSEITAVPVALGTAGILAATLIVLKKRKKNEK